jgi:hypothetical protein
MAEHPQAGVDYPRAWHELLAWFPDDAACLRYLEWLRWGNVSTQRRSTSGPVADNGAMTACSSMSRSIGRQRSVVERR